MPALEARLSRFENAHTQVMSISIDSAPVHAAFGSSLGGISYPMLADFHPKGEMSQSYGVYLADHGLTDRATVIVDASGIVRHASSIGQRNMDTLAELCEEIDAAHGDLGPAAQPEGLGAGPATLYVRDNCGPSRSALWACTNLHLDSVTIKNVSQNPELLAELKALSGSETAPVLSLNGKLIADSAAIVGHLAATCSRL